MPLVSIAYPGNNGRGRELAAAMLIGEWRGPGRTEAGWQVTAAPRPPRPAQSRQLHHRQQHCFHHDCREGTKNVKRPLLVNS